MRARPALLAPILPLLLMGSGGGTPPRATRVSPVASPLHAASAGAFSGRYKLTLVAGTNCAMPLGSVSLLVDVTESPVQQPPGIADPIASGSEVYGQAAAAADSTVGKFVLLRQGDRLHGGFGTKDLGVLALEGIRVWVRLAGTAVATTTSLGRPQAQGTAIGDIELSRPTDDAPDTLGACLGGRDHTWSLVPQ